MFVCVFMPGFGGSAVEFASAFSSLLEEVASDVAVFDIEGSELLFGRPGVAVRKIARKAVEAGCKANVAAAPNPDSAIHAALNRPGITVINPGEEAKFLGALPLNVLQARLVGVDDEQASPIIETLELWGIRSFGDFAALPESGVSERFGPEGVRLQKLARGTSDRPLATKQIGQIFENRIELDDPVSTIEPLSFILAGLLNQLCAGLQAHSMATNELRLRLTLEDKTSVELTLEIPFPTRDQKVLLRLLLLRIEEELPKAAVTAVSIKAEPVKPRSTQNGLFQPLAPEPEKLELTIARIAKLVGAQNVGSPEILDTHRPGAFRMKRFQVVRNSPTRSRRRTNGQSKPASRSDEVEYRLGFRAFRPPLRAEVQAPRGYPDRIRARDARNAGRNINGRISQKAGPWRTTGDWWAEDGWARDEWDVAVGDSKTGSLFRIYRDLQTGEWFVEGMYD